MDGWMCWELPWGRTSVEGIGEWEGRGVWSDLPQLSAFSQCEKPSLELLDLMFLKMLPSIPSCVAACSHKMFSAVFRHFEQLHNSGFNTFDICLIFFFPLTIYFWICFGWAMQSWEAYEGFVTLWFLWSLQSKCRLPLFKLWAEDQRGSIGCVGIKWKKKSLLNTE